MTTVNAVKCPKCKDVIYSVATHDFHYCSCGDTFVDGGFDYLRFGGKNFKTIERVTIEVKESKQELYDDWNHSLHNKRKYGIIKEKGENA